MAGDFSTKLDYSRLYKSISPDLGSFSDHILVWDGDEVRYWLTDVEGRRNLLINCPQTCLYDVCPTGKPLPQVRKLCTLRADLSGLRSLERLSGSKGEYFALKCSGVLRFGGTQLQAVIQWKEGVRTNIFCELRLIQVHREYFAKVLSPSFPMRSFRGTRVCNTLVRSIYIVQFKSK